MAAKKRVAKKTSDSKTDPAVSAFLRELNHPLKKAIETVREIILGVVPEIQEGIKWNSPSFRTTDWFATLNLRQDRVWLILHTGATAKGKTMKGKVADSAGLIKWLANDRGLVMFDNRKDVVDKRAALQSIVREWIGHL